MDRSRIEANDVRVFLEAVSGKNAGARIPISGKRFLIGREQDCHLRAHSDLVSRHHCGIVVEPDGVVVLDLGSRHGTFVDGQRIDGRCAVSDGSRLRIGPMEFVIVVLDEPPELKDDTQTGTGSEPASLSIADPDTSDVRLVASSTAQTAATADATIEDRAPAPLVNRNALAGSHWSLRPDDVFLRVASGRNAGLEIPLRRHRFLIGRAKDCHLSAHSAEVSSRHCEILVQPNGVLVLDLGSRNGTFLDGERITGPRVLHDGARLCVGSLELHLEIRGPAGRRTAETVVQSSTEETVPELGATRTTPVPLPGPSPDAPIGPVSFDPATELEQGPPANQVEICVDPSGEFDLVEFLSEGANETAKPPPVDILAEIRKVADELAPPSARNKPHSTKETKEAAVDGLKRMFTPRSKNE
jgi:pSer/pThr/pTyr-binding forkhead associated (FHA) protein